MQTKNVDSVKSNAEENAVYFLYKDIQRNAQPKAKVIQHDFVKLRQADLEFWTTVLWSVPRGFSFWLQQEIPKVKASYMKHLDSEDIETVCTLVETTHLQNNYPWSDAAKQEAEECVEKLARQLVTLDGGHYIWDHAVCLAKSGKCPEGLITNKFSSYAQDIIEKDKKVTELRNRLIVSNLRFALKLAIKQSKRKGSDLVWYADLVQDATVGLMDAVNHYDPYRGFAFTTYASYWVKNSMTRRRAYMGRTVPHPTHVRYFKRQIGNVMRKYKVLHNRIPTEEELCTDVPKLTPDLIEKMSLVSTNPVQSLNVTMPLGQGSSSADTEMVLSELQDLVEDTSPSIDEVYEQGQVISQLYKILRDDKILHDQERRVISLYFGLTDDMDQTLKEIGTQFGLSRERIRIIRNKAIDKIRVAFSEQDTSSLL